MFKALYNLEVQEGEFWVSQAKFRFSERNKIEIALFQRKLRYFKKTKQNKNINVSSSEDLFFHKN